MALTCLWVLSQYEWQRRGASPDIISPAGEICKEDFLTCISTVCPVSGCINHLWNWRREEGESSLQRAAGDPSLYHPTGTGAQPGQRCMAKPVSPAIIPDGGMLGWTGPGTWQQAAPRKEQAPGGAGCLCAARTSWAAARQAGNQRHFPCCISSRIQRNSPSCTTSEQYLIPSLISSPVWK